MNFSTKQDTYHGAVKNTKTGRGVSAERTISANCASVDIIFPPDLATNKLVVVDDDDDFEDILLLLDDGTTNDSLVLLLLLVVGADEVVVVLDDVVVVLDCCCGLGIKKASHINEFFEEIHTMIPIMTIENNSLAESSEC